MFYVYIFPYSPGGGDDTLPAGHCHPVHPGLPEEDQGKQTFLLSLCVKLPEDKGIINH